MYRSFKHYSTGSTRILGVVVSLVEIFKLSYFRKAIPLCKERNKGGTRFILQFRSTEQCIFLNLKEKKIAGSFSTNDLESSNKLKL